MVSWKIITGVLVFGSLWGFSECILGSLLHDAGLPAGVLMASIFAIGFMTLSRLMYRQRGMQVSMGFIAGTMRLFNPFGACYICSALAILASGVLFELVWYRFSLDAKEFKTIPMQTSMGVVSAYIVYVGGYIITQILTPLLSTAGFYLENLVYFLPQIFASGLLAAILGGVVVPVVFLSKNVDISRFHHKLYYPVTVSITLLCWIGVIVHTLFFVLM